MQNKLYTLAHSLRYHTFIIFFNLVPIRAPQSVAFGTGVVVGKHIFGKVKLSDFTRRDIQQYILNLDL